MFIRCLSAPIVGFRSSIPRHHPRPLPSPPCSFISADGTTSLSLTVRTNLAVAVAVVVAGAVVAVVVVVVVAVVAAEAVATAGAMAEVVGVVGVVVRVFRSLGPRLRQSPAPVPLVAPPWYLLFGAALRWQSYVGSSRRVSVTVVTSAATYTDWLLSRRGLLTLRSGWLVPCS